MPQTTWRLALAPLSFALLALPAACGGDDTVATTPPPPTAPEFTLETVTLASTAKPARTPGSPGVTVDPGSKLAVQFGGTAVDLNRVRYTRYALTANAGKPVDAVLVAMPGTLAAANSYLVLAENFVRRMWQVHGKVVELWGVDRRSVLLQDMAGLDVAERERSPLLALNWLYGGELGLALDPKLPRRAVFHDHTDVAFMANWSSQVHSLDLDAIVEQARAVARNQTVFLGGHSAGTGFAARYAATDFNLTGAGDPQPGYRKLAGLVLFEGPGGALAAATPTPADLDAVIAAADGGLYDRVAAGAEPAYVSRPGLTPRVNAATEVSGLQIAVEGTINGTQALLQADQGAAGNNVYAKVADFTPRAFPVTAGASIGTFMDDDNLARTVFYSVSLGFLGDARADGARVWLDNDTPLPATAFRDFGAMPATVSLATPAWGKEAEPTNLKRFARAFYLGQSTYSDWYYPSSGLLVGNSAAGGGGANLGLDTSALSLPVAQGGRGRADIVNQTQARKIDIPVIAFGGTNGLTPVPGIWRGFAEAIAPCAAPSCTPGVARTPANQAPLAANRTYGGEQGGFEVFMSEGYSHVDVLTAEDDATNNVVGPLVEFVNRNLK